LRRNQSDIAVAEVIALLGCVAFFVHLPTPLMVVLGLGLFAAPGYVWSAVFVGPRVHGLELVAVATGVALLVPVFGGLGLYAAGIPLDRTAWIGLLSVVTLVGAAVLLITRRRAREPDEPRSRPARPRWSPRPAAAFAAAVVIAAAAVGLAVASAEAQKYPGYTELWMTPLRTSQDVATLGVTNEQGGATRYRLVLRRKGRVSATWNLSLGNGQTWQRTISFTDTYLIAADLYRLPDMTQPFREVGNGD
jgi:hypothetical protein